MKEYLEFLKKHFSLLKNKAENELLNSHIKSQIKNNYKNDILPFNNNLKLFESIINNITDTMTTKYGFADIEDSYIAIDKLYSISKHNLNNELEIELYTNLFNLSVVTSVDKLNYLFNIISNKSNLLLLTNYIFNNELITNWDYSNFNHFFNYILEVRILFKDENSYLSYVINFINKFIKEKQEFDYWDIKLYLQEFTYLDNIDDKLLESIKEKECSTNYRELINSFNSKEQIAEEIESKLSTLNNQYSSKINKLKEMKEKLINLNSEIITFYDNCNCFNNIKYEDVKDYILYLKEYQNKHFNSYIFNIIELLLKEKSIFIDAQKHSLIFNTINQISDLLNTEIIKINYGDIDLLKNINLDNNKKYLVCITLSDEYDVYKQSDILDLEDRFNNDNFRFIYINYNKLNINTFVDSINYVEDLKLNKDVELFINNISLYMILDHGQINIFNKYYESKLFNLEDIFELLFKDIKMDISIINSSFGDELTKKFVDYLISKKNNLVKIK